MVSGASLLLTNPHDLRASATATVNAVLLLLLVGSYILRPFLVSSRGSTHPLLLLQRAGGLVTVLAGWVTLFFGCAAVYYGWVRQQQH